MKQIKKIAKKLRKLFRKWIQTLFGRKGSGKKVSKNANAANNVDIRKKKREKYIAAVMEKTGWSREYAIVQMKKAREEVGCNARVYAYHAYYELTKEEQIKAYEKWTEEQEKQKERKRIKLENCVQQTIAATGWDEEFALEQIRETMARTGCLAEEYRLYRFWALSPAEQEKFFLMSYAERIRAKYNNNLNIYRLIQDKQATNAYFAQYIDRRWCSNRETDYEQFRETFAGCKKLFYKPVSSFGGNGAKPFDLSEENCAEVYEQIMALPEGIVEEFVVQHPDLSRMSPNVLNTIRLTSIASDGFIDKEGNRFAIPYAMLKMGGKKGCVDNLKQGGVGAAIDLTTGELCTDAVDVDLNTYTHHPVTGVQIKGFQVPYFAEARQMVQRIVEENSMYGYFAWDVAITERGPMLIEINAQPASSLLELPFYNTPLRGRKCVMEKYL